jgi:NADH dehydrogenase (ubiquinone) Fe-S protein 7
MTALTPFQVAAASISQSTKNPAQEVAPPVRGYGAGIVKGNPGPPPSMKALSTKMNAEVPLASQEGNTSAVQYAL